MLQLLFLVFVWDTDVSISAGVCSVYTRIITLFSRADGRSFRPISLDFSMYFRHAWLEIQTIKLIKVLNLNCLQNSNKFLMNCFGRSANSYCSIYIPSLGAYGKSSSQVCVESAGLQPWKGHWGNERGASAFVMP